MSYNNLIKNIYNFNPENHTIFGQYNYHGQVSFNGKISGFGRIEIKNS